ncbi:SDR family oxidoreductase [Cypionkella sp.]|uniref:SDR family NAD(P)-dependent oxidoreductase n=1 Tax=Cypionkella sp. TaxID=2811411 RepID=UPI002ABC98AC|nr:SDR family oxidoreductase [Cypionkella sp.]MDZ4394353.1 SDR family oxidoreductase [Cypionkella sp.]
MKQNPKCTLITGAASGIGLATAKRFAVEGHALVLVDQNAESLAAAAAAMPNGVQVLICAAKVTDPDAVNDCIEQAVARFGGIDCLVTSAGIVKTGNSLDVSLQDFRAHMDVNVVGSWLFAQAVARDIVRRGKAGSIVMIGSVYGASGAPMRAAYCASKGAIHNLTESLAVEWGPLGIRVNTVAPTGVRTPMVQALIDAGTYDTKGVKARTPLGRLAEPEEVANACWFLASDQATMITGTVLRVDGGWLANGYTCN